MPYLPATSMCQATCPTVVTSLERNTRSTIPYHVKWVAWYMSISIKWLEILGTMPASPIHRSPPPRFVANLKSYLVATERGEGAGEDPKPQNLTTSYTDRYPREGLWADLLIRGQFDQGTDLLVDVRVTDLNSKSQVRTRSWRRMIKVIRPRNWTLFLAQHRNFTRFVVSPDGMIGHEAMS